jgi:hypothetical protein
MKLPFTIEQFIEVFRLYNESIWPMQIFFNLLALVCLYIVFRRTSFSDKFISISLALLWLWMGVVYNIIIFASINKAAYLFGSLFIIQSVIFVYFGIIKRSLQFEYQRSFFSYTAIILVIFALIIYPLLGYTFGHIYPSSPTFGLPCPTTIFTLGIILFIRGRIRYLLIVIPLLWSVIGFSAALTLGIFEDTGLLAAGVITVVLVLIKNRKRNILQSEGGGK